MTSVLSTHIYIVGTGTVAVRQMTREVEAAIRQSNEILFVDSTFGVEDHLRTLCPRVTNLHRATYREREDRLGAYSLMAAMVLDAALSRPPVTFALYGHPLVYALPPFRIMAAAELLGLKVKVFPGISALDAILVDLRLDPCTNGLQMYEASDILLRERPLQPDVPCLIWQIGTVESRLYSTRPSTPDRFTRFKEYLLRFYSPEHELVAVASSTHPLAASTVTKFRLEHLEQQSELLHQGVTVYIPPQGERAVSNATLASAFESPEHLEHLVTASP